VLIIGSTNPEVAADSDHKIVDLLESNPLKFGVSSDPKVDTEDAEDAGVRDGADARGLPLFEGAVLGGALGPGGNLDGATLSALLTIAFFRSACISNLLSLISSKGFGFGGPSFGAARPDVNNSAQRDG